jgi:hypothetical protein
MSLAGYQHYIARVGKRNGNFYGLFPVSNPETLSLLWVG